MAAMHFEQVQRFILARDILGLGHLKLPDTLNFRDHFVKKEKKMTFAWEYSLLLRWKKKMLDITSGHLLSTRFDSHGVHS